MKNSAEKPRRRLKKGTVSALQDLAIVLLLVLGVALSAAGGLLPADVVAGWLAGKAQSGEEADEGYAPAAAPYCIVLTPEDGAHCAVMYNGEELAETYGRFSAMLGEALGSSFGAEAVTEDDWRAALGGQGVYFDFYNDFLLSTYAIWLGTTMTGDSSGHRGRGCGALLRAPAGQRRALLFPLRDGPAGGRAGRAAELRRAERGGVPLRARGL